MTLILTNDDGIDAPGIQSLLQAVSQFDRKAIIVAPQAPHSGCGHQVTTTKPIHVQQRSTIEYAIGGTPADCVRIALNHLAPKTAWVLSGINAGGNLGSDVYVSGTVAAVREAALYRIPGVALSQYRRSGHAIDWAIATELTTRVLLTLFDRVWEPGTYWNVNLPHLDTDAPTPDIVFCQPCTQPLPGNYRVDGDYFYYAGEYAGRRRDIDSDVDMCFSGRIAITQIRL
ncbi:5'/3'-nucleotidase SurE [Stenomitos frigidus]|uniref:5'-nucleotidase n=1 Tax=Stenomitos frigidus ULC18 TaxID=2107698 RepID=A0A2T1E256_9CYAN|nr:5'/3'-nucleotidase SurE [Stenomitos frigidus]PSB26828.1 5'/3'-nucleotidase SurE [Stenomitos frigidus ULC18]